MNIEVGDIELAEITVYTVEGLTILKAFVFFLNERECIFTMENVSCHENIRIASKKFYSNTIWKEYNKKKKKKEYCYVGGKKNTFRITAAIFLP